MAQTIKDGGLGLTLAPRAPASPVAPISPVGPLLPSSPWGPGAPWGPELPWGKQHSKTVIKRATEGFQIYLGQILNDNKDINLQVLLWDHYLPSHPEHQDLPKIDTDKQTQLIKRAIICEQLVVLWQYWGVRTENVSRWLFCFLCTHTQASRSSSTLRSLWSGSSSWSREARSSGNTRGALNNRYG